MTAELAVNESKALELEASALVAEANALTIANAAEHQMAGEFLKATKGLHKRITEFFAPHKQRAHQAWKGLCNEEGDQLAPVQKAETIVNTKILAWQRAEREREEIARREREREALRLEEERRLQEAQEAQDDGDAALADEILTEPIHAPVIVSAPAPKVQGIATTKRWTFDRDRVDVTRVICHIAGVAKLAHPELARLLQGDNAAIQQRVTSDREHFDVAGIDAFEKEGLSVRGR